MGGKRIWKALKWFSRPIEWLRMGERQGVEGEIRQQERKFINLKNLRYINKQNKITITKEMTKCKGKGQKRRREEKRREEENKFCLESNSRPSARQAVSLLLRHVKHIAKMLIMLY